MSPARRSGSSPPTSNAPFFAPFSEAASGPLTHRMMPAPDSACSRDPTDAPAAAKSSSGIAAPSPAPASTATSAPRAMNFFAVSGVAATRVSPLAVSLRTAIFTLADDHDDDEGDDEAGQRPPFEQPGETLVITNVMGDFGRGRVRQQRLFFVGHVIPLV